MNFQEKAPFSSVFLLVRSEELALLDRRALRDTGVRQITVLTSGIQAARKLAESVAKTIADKPEMVLCHEQLADMSSDIFIRLVRMHPALVPFPILMVVSTNTPEVREKAKNAGCNGLLARPYTPASLMKQMRLVAEYQAKTYLALGNRLKDDPQAFRTALESLAKRVLIRSNNADQLYRGALLFLRQQNWDEAVATLERANKLAPEKGDIVLALSAAWLGKKDQEKSRSLLREAVSVFAEAGDWDKAAGVSTRLLRDYPDEPHPFFAQARHLLSNGKADIAVQVLQSAGFTGSKAAAGPESNAWAYEQIARGCMEAPSKKNALNKLKSALIAKGEKECVLPIERYVLARLNGAENILVRERQEANKATQKSELAQTADAKKTDEPVIPLISQDNSEESLKNLANTVSLETKNVTSSKNLPDSEPVIPLIQEPVPSSALKGFPLLRDALTIAKVTAGLLKVERKKNK